MKTTDSVRHIYALGGQTENHEYGIPADSKRELFEDFDRWLNEERAKAWDRAIDFFEINIYGEATAAKDYNPYRKADQ